MHRAEWELLRVTVWIAFMAVAAMFCLVALDSCHARAECGRSCRVEADPVSNAVQYRVCVVREWNDGDPVIEYPNGIDCALTDEPALNIPGTPLDRAGAYAVAWKAQDSQGRESAGWSNIVWFNLFCARHTGEIVDHGAWQERLACESICEPGGVRELPERYPECAK